MKEGRRQIYTDACPLVCVWWRVWLWSFSRCKINFNTKSFNFLKVTCVCTKHCNVVGFIHRKLLIDNESVSQERNKIKGSYYSTRALNYPAASEYAKTAFPPCLSLEGAASLFSLNLSPLPEHCCTDSIHHLSMRPAQAEWLHSCNTACALAQYLYLLFWLCWCIRHIWLDPLTWSVWTRRTEAKIRKAGLEKPQHALKPWNIWSTTGGNLHNIMINHIDVMLWWC